MDEMHSLLKRQLRRSFGSNYNIPPELQDFISSINSAYHEFDTDRKMLERSLEISSQELIQANAETGSMVNLFPDAFLWLDLNGTILESRSTNQIGLDRLQNILGASHLQKMQPEDVRDALQKAINRSIETNFVSNFNFSIDNKGLASYYEARVIPPLANRILVIIRDVTEQNLAEESLQESESRFRELVELLPVVIFETDLNINITYVNSLAFEMSGYTKEEFIQKPVLELIVPKDHERITANISKILAGEESGNNEYTFITRDGRRLSAIIRAVAKKDRRGELIGLRGIWVDITERKRMEERIIELYQKEKHQREILEEEARVRGLFIDVLGHELRTPLTPILASSSMLQDLTVDNPDDIYKKLIDNINNGSNVLARRLEELLDLARYSRGTFKLNILPVNLDQFIRDVLARFVPSLQRTGQQLIEDIPSPLPEANIDVSRLEQVIINLLSNASKFSPKQGKIYFRAVVEDRQFQVDVKDQGIGIPREAQKRLFQPYHRVEQDRQQFPGLGLGLAVAKQIVEAHEGKIWLTSQSGQGSTFSFRIPLR